MRFAHSKWSAAFITGLVAFCPIAAVQGQETAPRATPAETPQQPTARPAPPADVPPVDNPRERRMRRGDGEARIPDNLQLVRDVIYSQAPGQDGKTIDLKMDTMFLKESDGKPMPVIVYIHGGGWKGGSKQMGLRPSIGSALGGYFAVSIQYRLSGQAKYPAAVQDCKAAIRFIRDNAEELGVDPDRIGVWGHSAGGHLASLLGTSGNSRAFSDDAQAATSSVVQCVVDISGPIDLSPEATGMIAEWLGGTDQERPALAKQASPLTHIDANDPPVLIIHGTEDQIVGSHHAEMFEKALKEAGVKVEYIPAEGAGHAVTDPELYVRAAEFFDEHLGGNAAKALRDRMDQMRDQMREGGVGSRIGE